MMSSILLNPQLLIYSAAIGRTALIIRIPLLAQWLESGMSMGSASAFMITGPATKITNLGAVKIVLGVRHFALYILFSILFAFTTGIIINGFL